MPNELLPNNPLAINIVPNTTVQTVQQTGEKNVYANHVDQLNLTVQNINTALPLIMQTQTSSVKFPSCEYYNLVVTDELDIQGVQPFTLDIGRCLTEYMENDVKAMFSTLTDEMQKQILTFPTVFANENISGYNHTDEEQLLGLWYIRQIKIRRDKIKIYPLILCQLPQQRFNEAYFDLDLYSGYELHRTHWSIKKVDLIAELRELGFQL